MPLIVYFSNLTPQKLDTAVDWQLSFAGKYKENQCDYIWLVFSSRFNNKFKAFKKEGLDVQIIPTKYTNGFRLIIFLLKFIVNYKVDVFHMHFIKPWNAISLILLVKILLQKTVFIYHKRSPGRLVSNKFNIKKYINPLSVLSLFVDKIVCNSDSIVENCLNRGVKNKPIRIYNGIRIERFAQVNDTGKIYKEFNIPQDCKVVSIIKDARPEVGLKDLLLSISNVLAIFPKTIFLIVGGGVETDNLKVLVKELNIVGNVIFMGIRNDVPNIIAESYFTIDPSPVEAFGNVIIESMAGKKPVIAVNAWGPKEIIKNGESGILVEHGNPTNFAPAIIELLASPEKVSYMGENSFERVKQYFTVDHMINETVKLTLNLLDGKLNSKKK